MKLGSKALEDRIDSHMLKYKTKKAKEKVAPFKALGWYQLPLAG